ncbi:pentatricopeptide repeat-containing protein At4g21065-like [Primulina huaijiensis]|uniref:pentatricopeptide repeat-containing protein At4g21065-like n=1 Tax=Primulina huaijiensis TaxID=1492673 RepID=UPI003CC71CDC
MYSRILTHASVKPNNYTYPSLFKAFGSHQWLEEGKSLHVHVLKFLGSPIDKFIQASLVNFYSRCGKVGLARYIFNRIMEPDLATWNSMLSAYARNATFSLVDNIHGNTGFSLEVLSLFSFMQKSLLEPNEVSLVALITACADIGALSQACQLFRQLARRDAFCFNAMIRGLAIHGRGNEALGLFRKMIREGFAPDDTTILSVMNACSHVGLVEEGRKYFKSMKSVYRLEPKIEHYCCLVDLLGRAGLVEDAEEIVLSMPMKPNAILWRSLLGAARVHGNVDIGEIALRKLLELEPETSGSYVLLSNMYAFLNRWEDVNRLRSLMKRFGIDKTPGSSIVEVNGSMHEFLIGDRSHPKVKDIYSKLEEMNKKLQEFGHLPRTRDVLFDIEDEEREEALSYHSERLAISFALLESDACVPIRIIKNLRVCVDCHSCTKLFSKMYMREIIVRDRTRFHHFKNGTCSCLDYW